MVKRLCPRGVQVKALGDLGTFVRGNGMQKKDLVGAGFPAIHYGQIHTYYGTAATETLSFVTNGFARQLRKAEPGDLIVVTTSEDDGAVGKAVAWLGATAVAVSGDAYIYRHSLVPKYASYFFQSGRFQQQKQRAITGTKVRRITGDNLAKITIPVPPVAVQEEVVRTLDSFHELEVELQTQLDAELQAHQQRYEHYRDGLLSFSKAGGVRSVPMGEIGSFFGGLTGKSKADFSHGNGRFVSYRNVYNNIAVDPAAEDFVRVEPGEKQRSLQRGDILFTGSSETADEVAISSVVTNDVSKPLYLNSFCIGYRLHDPALLDPEFSKHLLRSGAMRKQLIGTASGVTRFNVSKARLAKVEIPIPDLDAQRQIAAILDKFAALVKDLSLSLSAERKARRAQYEHYRDRLLAFTEAAA